MTLFAKIKQHQRGGWIIETSARIDNIDFMSLTSAFKEKPAVLSYTQF